MNRYEFGTNSWLTSRHHDRYWHWRRIVAVVVLITFSSSIFSPVFASDTELLNNQDSTVNLDHDKTKIRSKSAKVKNKRKKLDIKKGLGGSKSTSLPIKAKESSHVMDRHFTARANQLSIQPFSSRNKYQPYFELGGAKYFNQHSNVAGIYDLFIPLLQTEDQLVFTDLRVFDRSGSAFEGNVHLGYRKLFLDKKQLIGVYAAFDRKRSEHRNWFSQITIGGEYWYDQWFIGGNFYQSVGKNKRVASQEYTELPRVVSRTIFTSKEYERSQVGIDGEVGYAFTDNLTGYIGGYYFHAHDTDTTAGPKARVTYSYNQEHGRILGVLDGISIEAGVQHDQPRGNTAYIGIKFKVGLTNIDRNSNLFGFERHMTDLVRRDPDIVIEKNIAKDQREEVVFDSDENVVSYFNGRKREAEARMHEETEYDERSDKVVSGVFSYWNNEDLLEYRDWLTHKLGFSKDLSIEELKKAKRSFVFTYHGDKNVTNPRQKEMEDVFKENHWKYQDLEKVMKILEVKEQERLVVEDKSGVNIDVNKVEAISQLELANTVNTNNVDQQCGDDESNLLVSKLASKNGNRSQNQNQSNNERENGDKEVIDHNQADRSSTEIVLQDQGTRANVVYQGQRSSEESSFKNEVSTNLNGISTYLWGGISWMGAEFRDGANWVGDKVYGGAHWLAERPKVLTIAIITLVGSGIGLIKHNFFRADSAGDRLERGSTSDEVNQRNDGDEQFFGGSDDNSDDSDDMDFPPHQPKGYQFLNRQPSKGRSWLDILRKIPLFFTLGGSSGTVFPVLLSNTKDSVTDSKRLNKLPLTTSVYTPPPITSVGSSDSTILLAGYTAAILLNRENSLNCQVEELRRELKLDKDGYFKDNQKLVPLLDLPDWNYEREGTRDKEIINEDNSSQEELLDEDIFVNLNYEYEDQDLNALLKLRAKAAGLDLSYVTIMAPLSGTQEQLKSHLLEELDRYQKRVSAGTLPFARTILVPVNLYNLHWVGLVISFNEGNQTSNIQYIDSLGYEIPEEIAKSLRAIYGEDIVIQNSFGLKQTDGMACGPLMVENLILAAKNQLEARVTTEQEIKKIRNRHIILLEDAEPELQFYFRQKNNIRSFEYQTASGTELKGGLFAGLVPRSVYKNDRSHLTRLNVVISGGMDSVENFSDTEEISHEVNLDSGINAPLLGAMMESMETTSYANDYTSSEVSMETSIKKDLAPMLGIGRLDDEFGEAFSIIKLSDAIKIVLKKSLGTIPLRAIKEFVFLAVSLIMSHTGREERSAATTIFAIEDFLSVIFSGPILMLYTEVGKLKKRRTAKYIGREVQAGWLLGLVCSIPYVMLGAFAKPLLIDLNQRSVIAGLARDFYNVYLFSIPALMVESATELAGQSVNKFTLPVVVHTVGLVASSFFSYVLTFGKGFFPKLGITGSAYGLLVRAYLNLILTNGYIYLSERNHGKYERYRFFKKQKGVLKSFVNLVKQGGGLFFMFLFQLGGTFTTNIWIGQLGLKELSAQLVVSRWQPILLTPVAGISSVAQMVVASTFKDRPRSSLRLGNVATLLSTSVPILYTLLTIFAPKILIAPFLDLHDERDDSIVEMLTDGKLLLISGLSLIANAIRMTFGQALFGKNKVVLPIVVNFIGIFSGVGFSYLFGFAEDMGITGINLGALIGQVIGSIGTYLYWLWSSKDKDY